MISCLDVPAGDGSRSFLRQTARAMDSRGHDGASHGRGPAHDHPPPLALSLHIAAVWR